MTNDDRELIVLAGKAVGMKIGGMGEFRVEKFQYLHNRQLCEKYALVKYEMGSNEPVAIWNPLEDDGDAFRLAVALHMDINSYPCTQEIGAVQHKHNKICDGNQHRMFEKTWQQDAISATRRAIVRAAAEIGRTKPCAATV